MMWAPENYLPFPSIEREISRVVAKANPITRPLSTYDARQLRLLDFAWGGFMESCASLSLCSPSGAVIRVAAYVGLRVREPLSNGGFAREWMFLNSDLGIVDTSEVSDRSKMAKLLLAGHMVGLDPEFAIPNSLNEYQWSCLGLAAEADKFLPVLANFEGWALCCKETDRPAIVLSDFSTEFEDLSFDDWDDMFAMVPPVQPVSTSMATVGRPNTKPQVLSVYRKIYPSGHGRVPWKVVLRELKSAGVDCKLDTLRRAIKSGESQG